VIGTAKLFQGCRWLNETENDCSLQEKEQEKIITSEKKKSEIENGKDKNQESKSSEKNISKVKYVSDNCEQLEDIENWNCEKGAVIFATNL